MDIHLIKIAISVTLTIIATVAIYKVLGMIIKQTKND